MRDLFHFTYVFVYLLSANLAENQQLSRYFHYLFYVHFSYFLFLDTISIFVRLLNVLAFTNHLMGRFVTTTLI